MGLITISIITTITQVTTTTTTLLTCGTLVRTLRSTVNSRRPLLSFVLSPCFTLCLSRLITAWWARPTDLANYSCTTPTYLNTTVFPTTRTVRKNTSRNCTRYTICLTTFSSITACSIITFKTSTKSTY